ncbi:retrovirus-related pol polyprotein from transposon TNT 1-94 [Tanacetum coccineum]
MNNPNVIAAGDCCTSICLNLSDPLDPRVLNNMDAHIDYIKYSWEHADTLREIVEHARALRPLDSDSDSACKIVQRIQEVLVYVKDTCPSLTKPSEKLVAITPLNKNKKVRFAEDATSFSNTQKQADSHKTQDPNKHVLPSIGMKSSTSASRSQPSGNTKNNRILRTTSSNMKNKVEDHPRSVKSKSNKMNRVIEPVCNAHVKHTMLNANSELICVKCNQCMFDANHDVCFLEFVNDVNVRSKSKSAKKSKKKYLETHWITSTKVVPLKETTSKSVTTQNPQNKADNRRPNITKSVGSSSKSKVVQIVLWYLDSGCSKHMTGNRSQLINFVHKFFGTVRFGNDQIAKIMGYGDYQMGKVTISQVYYVEGLGHNLFSVGQFCDSDLEVAFRKHTCYIRDLEGVDLLKGSRGSNLYTLSLEDMMLSSPICLLSKASKTKSWLWHRRLSHLNFDYITTLAKQGLVRGLPRLKFQKDHLCSACALGKSKKHSHKPKAEDSIQEKLYLLHMDLCGPMRIQSINGRKYILVIVDDYSRFTWVKFLRSKDEVPEFPMFDEYFNPPPSVASLVLAVAAPVLADSTGSPSSTLVNQDAPSPSTSQTPQESQSLVASPGVVEEFHDIEVAHLDNDPFFGVPIPEPNSKESSSRDVIPTNVHSVNQPPKHLRK